MNYLPLYAQACHMIVLALDSLITIQDAIINKCHIRPSWLYKEFWWENVLQWLANLHILISCYQTYEYVSALQATNRTSPFIKNLEKSCALYIINYFILPYVHSSFKLYISQKYLLSACLTVTYSLKQS